MFECPIQIFPTAFINHSLNPPPNTKVRFNSLHEHELYVDQLRTAFGPNSGFSRVFSAIVNWGGLILSPDFQLLQKFVWDVQKQNEPRYKIFSYCDNILQVTKVERKISIL